MKTTPSRRAGKVEYGLDDDGRPLVVKRYANSDSGVFELTLYRWSECWAESVHYRNTDFAVMNGTAYMLVEGRVMSWARFAVRGIQEESVAYDAHDRPVSTRMSSREPGRPELILEYRAEYSPNGKLLVLRGRNDEGRWGIVFRAN